jgi:hypothetical protein
MRSPSERRRVILDPSRPVPVGEEGPIYSLRLQRTDGTPADPPTYRSLVLSWKQGEVIELGGDRRLRVLGVRDDDADQPPVLVVEEMPGSGSSAAA